MNEEATSQDLRPPLLMSEEDYTRLSGLARAIAKRSPLVARLLAEEVDRADVVPAGQVPGLVPLLPVFLLALGLGIASGSPGGIGPFEATLLALLPGIEASGLLAGILAFRVLAYALPAACGAAWVLASRRGDPGDSAHRRGSAIAPHPRSREPCARIP